MTATDQFRNSLQLQDQAKEHGFLIKEIGSKFSLNKDQRQYWFNSVEGCIDFLTGYSFAKDIFTSNNTTDIKIAMLKSIQKEDKNNSV